MMAADLNVVNSAIKPIPWFSPYVSKFCVLQKDYYWEHWFKWKNFRLEQNFGFWVKFLELVLQQ